MKLFPAPGYLRWALIFLAVVLLLSIVVLAALALLLNTDRGSRWAVYNLVDRLNHRPSQLLSIHRSSGTLLRGMTFEQVSYQAGQTQVELGQLQVEWNPFSLLSGRLILNRLVAEDLLVEVRPQVETDDARWTMPEFTFVALPLSIELSEVSVSGIRLDLADNSYLVDTLMLRAELTGQNLAVNDLHLVSPLLNLDASLGLGLSRNLPLDASIQWRYRGQLLQEISSAWREAEGGLVISGDLESLQVQHQLLLPIEVASTGELRTGLLESDAMPAFDLRHDAALLQLPFPGLEETEFSSVQLLTSGSLDLPLGLQLQTQVSVADFPAIGITARGRLSAERLQVEEIQLNTGTGSLTGSGDLQLQPPFAAQMNYSLTDVDLLPYLNISLPLRLSPVSATGTVDIAVPETGLDANLLIESLNAQLGDFPLTGSGLVQLSNQQVNIDNLNLYSNGTHLSVNGSVTETLDIGWQLTVVDLQQIVAGGQGSFAVSGMLQGPLSAPDLQLSATGSDLEFGSTSLAALEIEGSGNAGNYLANLTARGLFIDNAQISEPLELVEVALSGSKIQHQLNVGLSSSFGSLDLELQGGFPSSGWQDWSGTFANTKVTSGFGVWEQDGTSNIEVAGANLELANSCWAREQTRLCLAANGTLGGRLDANASLQDLPLDIFNAAAPDPESGSMTALPKLPQTAKLQGSLTAEISVTLEQDSAYRFDFSSRIADSVLTLIPPGLELTAVDDTFNPEPQDYVIERMEAQGSGRNGEWDLSGSLDFFRSDIDATDLSMQGAAGFELKVIEGFIEHGNIRLDIGDLGWLEAFIPDISSVRGQLHGTAGLTGEITAPQLANVDFAIEEAEAVIPAMGINLEQLNARLTGVDGRQFVLSGSVRSDQGELNFSGDIVDPYTSQRELQLRVVGENFLFLQRDDLSVRATPDIVASASARGINLSGRLHLPFVYLQLDALPDTIVDVSRDTVIVSYPEDRPDLARSIAAAESTFYNLPVSVDLAITLGEQVSFSGFGLDARLTGALNIRQGNNGASLTYGELSVIEGTYGAYGTELTLERGKLLFFGAYDNPALDIRAVRQVEDLSVGLQINGTLKNISSQLFSSPALPDNDIIAVLVTGKPFAEVGEQESLVLLNAVAGLGLQRSEGLTNQIRDQLGLDALSIASTGDINNSMLTLGKYLSPSLFIRYGVGLFDSQSTVALDYKVSDSITLQAESGEYQSVDLIYRIER
ncbi:MAG: translocation/assembly module TamB domain-containing protein, partial [Pseudohongiellaceae bacterium]